MSRRKTLPCACAEGVVAVVSPRSSSALPSILNHVLVCIVFQLSVFAPGMKPGAVVLFCSDIPVSGLLADRPEMSVTGEWRNPPLKSANAFEGFFEGRLLR